MGEFRGAGMQRKEADVVFRAQWLPIFGTKPDCNCTL